MAFLYERKDSRFLWASFKKGGKRKKVATKFTKEQSDLANAFITELTRREALDATTEIQQTVRQWAEEWFLHRRKTIRSFKDDESRIRMHICGTDKTPANHPTIGSLPLSKVSQTDIQCVFDSLRQRHERGDLASGTIRCIWASACVMFDDAQTKGLITANPMRLMSGTLPTVVKKPTLPYAIAEIEQILLCSAIPEDRRVVYGLLFFLGARFGEVAALRWRDLDETTRPLAKISINKSWSNRTHQTGTTKTGANRDQPLHPVFAHILCGWREIGFKWLFGESPKPNDLIVPSRAKIERSSNHMLKRLREDLRRAQLSDIDKRKQHAFRTSFISYMRNAKVDKEQVRAMTHGSTASRDVIDSFYTKWDWDTLCKAVSTIQLSDGFLASYKDAYYADVTETVSVRYIKEKWRGGRDSNTDEERSEAPSRAGFPEPLTYEQILQQSTPLSNVTLGGTQTTPVRQRVTVDVTYNFVVVYCLKCCREMELETAPQYECVFCGGLAIPSHLSESGRGGGRFQERV